MSLLDDLHAAMVSAPDDDAARLRWYGALAGAELVLWLEAEPAGTDILPRVAALEEGRFVLAFADEARLAGFAAGAAPYAALPGRVIVLTLAGHGVGLAVDAGLPTQMFLGPEAVDWLAATLQETAEPSVAAPAAVLPPGAVPQGLAEAIGRVIGSAPGTGAWLVRAVGGGDGLMLAVGGAEDEGLVRALREAVVFSGLEAGALNVVFLAEDAPALAAIARVAVFFAPAAPAPAPQPRAAPGSDPARPPRLR